MMSQVFKVAKALTPSVIYIDEVEKVRPAFAAWPACLDCVPSKLAMSQLLRSTPRGHASLPWQVFIMDKKKARTFGGVEPFNRIRKELVKEVRLRTLNRSPHQQAPVESKADLKRSANLHAHAMHAFREACAGAASPLELCSSVGCSLHQA